MNRCPRWSILAITVVAWALLAAAAQTPVQNAGTPAVHAASSFAGSIDGVVLSAGGAPLDRADVTLAMADEQNAQTAEMVTGPTGRFHFGSLTAGKYRLEASRRGYITSAFEEHEGYFTGIVVGPGLESQGLQFRLVPEGIIGGVVTDDSGEPVGGAQVTLYHENRNNGTDHVVPADTDVTDDTGAYEFARLHPGTYYVEVSAKPWYAVPPQPRTDNQGNEIAGQTGSALDVAYPMEFYASATDSESATPLTLSPGDRLQANFSLHAVPAVHLQIRLPGGDGHRGLAIPQISVDAFGTEQSVPLNGLSILGHSSGGLTAEVNGLAPGSYELRQYGPQGEEGQARVDVTGNQVLDSPTVASGGVDVTGKAEMADGSRLRHAGNIVLAPGNGALSRRPHSGRLETDGTFSIHGVPPGTYSVQIGSMGAPLAVLQMAASGAQAEGNKITIGNDSVLLAATLVSGTATMNGFVKRDGKGYGGALVVLVPSGADPSQDLYRIDQSDSDGSFTLYRVFPGTYILVAIDGGWNLDWARKEVIAPYLPRGLKLQVTHEKMLDVTGAVEVQPAR